MKRKSYSNFILSAVLHAVLIGALVYFSYQQEDKLVRIPPPATIKSYVYQAPKAKPVVKEDTPRDVAPIEIEIKKEQSNKAISQKKSVAKKQEPPLEIVKPNATPVESENEEAVPKQQANPAFSPYAQLNKLRSDINQNISINDIPSYRGATSGSPMHGRQEVVPDSVVPETSDARHARTTQRYSDRLAITKNENGTCTIVEDLSAVGIEGVKAVSGFNCGESKDKKAFREHMEGVLKKLGKSN